MPIADRAKGTALTRIRFRDLDDRVRPELSAKVTFGPVPGTPTEPGKTGVPSTAVVTPRGDRWCSLCVRVSAEAVVQVGTPRPGWSPCMDPCRD